MKNTTKLKILLIGPLPPPVHGTTVSFQQLIRGLKKYNDIIISVIDTSRKKANFNYWNTIISAVRTVINLVYYVSKVDIVTFHASSNATLMFSPIIHAICRFFRKPWILRVFGGNIDIAYSSFPRWTKMVLDKTAFSANLCLFQTHQLVEFFREKCIHEAAWFSNSREMAIISASNDYSTVCRKFVYVGNIKYSKGLQEIIDASIQLKKGIIVDIFGPFQEGMTEDDFKGLNIVKYRGFLPSEKVITTLKSYDALVLPSYYKGEGYPGVILEAYAAGIPVIASNWRAIPEIVDITSGILVEPKNSKMLLIAMIRLIENPDYYRTLRNGVQKKRQQYSLQYWTENFVQYCKETLF